MNFSCRFFIASLLLSLMACDDISKSKTEGQSPPKKKPLSHLVEVSIAKRTDSDISQIRTGSLRARHEVKIYNQEEGKITSLPFFEGDSVKRGQLITTMDTSLLQAQLARVKASRNKSESELKRIKSLQKEAFLSEEQLIAVETELAIAKADETILKTRLGYGKIKAPFSGIITQRLSEVGNVAEKFSHLLTLSDPSSLITEVSISELLLNHIHPGDETLVQIDALGKQQYKGKVLRVHPTLNARTRRGIVEIEVNPVPSGAKPGQLCRVTIHTHAAKRLFIPLNALRRDSDGEFVYSINDDKKVERVAVVSGLHVNQDVEILSGLEPGQPVVIKGFLGLKPGKKVKPVNKNAKQKPTINE